MASGILVILDDIATLFDDVATQSKIATKQTVGVLGDDLAVGAQRASGFHASRELPVIWAITKGAFLNKLIILPLAFLLSVFAPQLIVPILLLGGLYLSYEGAEKIYEYLFHRHHSAPAAQTISDRQELLALEKKKIRSAILTDFILSIEIIVIALSSVADQSLPIQIGAVSFVAILATIGVYGLVALMVRMDDAGFNLLEHSSEYTGFKANFLKRLGQFLIASLPKLIRLLTIVGTLAMLLVGGGIFVHNLPQVHHAVESIPWLLSELGLGLILGIAVLATVKTIAWIKSYL